MPTNLLQFFLNQPRAELFVLMIPVLAIGELGLPFPVFLESILLFAGFKISQGQFIYFLVVLFSLVGSGLGATALYLLSRFFGEKVLAHYQFFRERRESVEITINKYRRWEPLTIAGLRLTPGLLLPASIASGILEISYWNFLAGVAISTLVYNLIFLSLGIIIGKNAHHLAANISFIFKLIFLVIAALIVLFLLWRFARPRRQEK